MAKVSILDLPIHTWSPNTKGQPYLAKIGDLPMEFRGKTSLQAHMAADEWRRGEVQKIADREAAKDARLAAARAARAAKQTESA